MNDETIETIPTDDNPELMPMRQSAQLALEPTNGRAPITPAQAKIDAVASLTMKAYDRASMLQLTDQEIEALRADFPDEAFLPGAAGKENLIYCQHSYLRERLNSVFRPGQWSIIPRNRWAEDFKTQKGTQASRVYVEAMLVIRGCFVAEAVGEMEYYPNNASQNYGDAVEGAKTAALRRCCKELGVGLQAWRKEWCDGWWQRKRGTKPPTAHQTPTNIPPAAKSAPNQAAASKEATPEQRSKMVQTIETEGKDAVERALAYFIEIAAIMPASEGLRDVPLKFVPTTHGQMRELGVLIAKLNDEGKAEKPSWITSAMGEGGAPAGTRSTPSPEDDGREPDFDTKQVDDGRPQETGVIQLVTLKEGKSAKGVWSLWGIKINNVFHNTFSNSLGKAAQKAKGKEATIYYTQEAKGRKIENLIIDGQSVEVTQ